MNSLIDKTILRYEKTKLLVLIEQDQEMDMVLWNLTEQLWDKCHQVLDSQLSNTMPLEQRAEQHFQLESYLLSKGWIMNCEYMGVWFYETYNFEFPEQRYEELLKCYYSKVLI